MSGYRPQNRGNKSGLRIGPVVARRLRQAGINISPAAAKYHREGVFVSARGLHISVLVDLGDPQRARESAEDVVRVVTSWGLEPSAQESTHDDGGVTITVSFTHPAPTPDEPSRITPSSGTAAPDGVEWIRAQASTVTATLASAGFWSSDGITVEQESQTAVIVRVADNTPDTVLTNVTDALRRKKYTVIAGGGLLTVRKIKKAKRS